MIVTWNKKDQEHLPTQEATISEELLDEHIETRFSQAKELYKDGFENANPGQLEAAMTVFYELWQNERLQMCRTDRHKGILFECSFHLAEILQQKDEKLKALKFYFKAVQIRPKDFESWTRMGDLFYMIGIEKLKGCKKALE